MNRLADDPAQRTRVTDLLDIGNLLDRRPGKLSGGERQRVALGRAAIVKTATAAARRTPGIAGRGPQGRDLPYLCGCATKAFRWSMSATTRRS